MKRKPFVFNQTLKVTAIRNKLDFNLNPASSERV